MNSVLLILRMHFQEVNLLHRLPMKKNDLQEKEQNTCICIPIPMFIHLLIAIHLKDSILSKIKNNAIIYFTFIILNKIKLLIFYFHDVFNFVFVE